MDGYVFDGATQGSTPTDQADFVLHVTHDGGRTWERSPLIAPIQQFLPGPSEDDAITGPSCISGKACSYSFEASTDHGRTWHSRSTMPATPSEISAARTGSSVWVYASELGAGDKGSTFLSTNDGGLHWADRAAPCESSSSGLSAAPDGHLWLVCGSQPGAGQQLKDVYRSDDGGNNWRLMASDGDFGQTKPVGTITGGGYVNSLAAVSDSIAWLALDRGSLLTTTDGGRTWVDAPGFPPPENFFAGLTFVDERHGWTAVQVTSEPTPNDRVYRTTDGGKTWRYAALP